MAARLAHDIRSAPRFPKGDVACPNDDGTAVDLYFGYGPRRGLEFASVELRGCSSVEATGRWPRRASTRLLHDLAAVAPQPWAEAIRQWTD